MIRPLTDAQQRWVDRSLDGMNRKQKIGQLLHPSTQPHRSEADYREMLAGWEPGGLFLFPGTREQFAETTAMAQRLSPTPLIVSSDLENGAGRMVTDATIFPDLMALAAADSDELADAMGEAAAIEGRALGVHWTFGPVVDINAHPHNPICNTRSLGDDPHRIARLAARLIRSMQDRGLAATAKHFPGDGYDDRDQHLCTTVNPLDGETWRVKSGAMFQAAIDAGVWSIMIGHVALPAVDPGEGGSIDHAPPATLSHKLTTEMLRGELGFEGMIITDAMGMGGVRSWGTQAEVVVRAIRAGCDQILFSLPHIDGPAIEQALARGELTEARLDDAVRRQLELKARLGLNESTQPTPQPDAPTAARFADAADRLAETALTVVRAAPDAMPVRLEPGRKVVVVHTVADAAYHVDGFDDLLRARGVEVDSYRDDWDMPIFHDDERLASYEAILLPFVYGPTWMTNRIRVSGPQFRPSRRASELPHPKRIAISFGTPYLEYDLPRCPTVINAYSPDRRTQEAVVRLLAGEITPRGVSPVDLDRPRRLIQLASRLG